MGQSNIREYISRYAETTILVLFLAIFFMIGAGGALENSISNPFPKGMVAADIFHYYNYIDGLEKSGKFAYFPPYISYGRTDVIAYQPPLYYVDSVIIAKLFGIRNYDAMQLLIFLSLAFAIIIIYFTIKRAFNKDVAMLSIPITLLILQSNFYTAISWGRTPTVLAHCLLIALVWVTLSKSDLSRNNAIKPALIGVFLSALALTHTPQLLFGAIFLMTYLCLEKIRDKRFSRNDMMFYSIILGVFVILSIYYLIVFKTTVASAQPIFGSMSATDTSAYRWPLFSNFGIFSYVLIIGMIATFIFKDKIATLFPFMMLIFGFSNLIIGKRALELRFMWPFFLCIFFGIAIYAIISLTKLKEKSIISIIITIIITAIICHSFVSSASLKGSIANEFSWDVVKFLQSTEQDARVLFFYNDAFYQTSYAMTSKRESFMIPIEESIKSIQANNISRNMLTDMAGEGQSAAAYRKEGKIHFFLNEFNHSDVRNICLFNYYVVPKYASFEEIAKYNMRIANYLISNNSATIVHDNQLFAVLKSALNPNCIPDGGVRLE